MFKVKIYNQLSVKGLDQFPRDSYELSSDTDCPDALLLRSYQLHQEPIALASPSHHEELPYFFSATISKVQHLLLRHGVPTSPPYHNLRTHSRVGVLALSLYLGESLY